MVDVDDQSEDKNESELCNIALSEKAEKVIVELNSMHGEAKKKIEELIETLRADKLKDHEIKKVLFERVNFVSRRTLYNALPQELKREYTKPLPKTINISTPHKVIEQSDHDWHYEQGEKEEERMEKIQEIKKAEAIREEDPKDLEIQFLKERVAELEDALKKTEQFRPATEYDSHMELNPISEETVFDWLGKREDKVSRYWFPNYGIELFRTRILSDLNNRGVKMFKRLYFEV